MRTMYVFYSKTRSYTVYSNVHYYSRYNQQFSSVDVINQLGSGVWRKLIGLTSFSFVNNNNFPLYLLPSLFLLSFICTDGLDFYRLECWRQLNTDSQMWVFIVEIRVKIIRSYFMCIFSSQWRDLSTGTFHEFLFWLPKKEGVPF